jgi:hypothetical protein
MTSRHVEPSRAADFIDPHQVLQYSLGIIVAIAEHTPGV